MPEQKPILDYQRRTRRKPTNWRALIGEIIANVMMWGFALAVLLYFLFTFFGSVINRWFY